MRDGGTKDLFETAGGLTRKETLRIEAMRLAIQAAPLMFQGVPITGPMLVAEAEAFIAWIEGKRTDEEGA